MMLQTDNYGMDIMCEKVDKSYQMRGLEWCCQMHDFKMFSFIHSTRISPKNEIFRY